MKVDNVFLELRIHRLSLSLSLGIKSVKIVVNMDNTVNVGKTELNCVISKDGLTLGFKASPFRIIQE